MTVGSLLFAFLARPPPPGPALHLWPPAPCHPAFWVVSLGTLFTPVSHVFSRFTHPPRRLVWRRLREAKFVPRSRDRTVSVSAPCRCNTPASSHLFSCSPNASRHSERGPGPPLSSPARGLRTLSSPFFPPSSPTILFLHIRLFCYAPQHFIRTTRVWWCLSLNVLALWTPTSPFARGRLRASVDA